MPRELTPALTVKNPNAQDNYISSTTLVSAVNLQACTNGATCTEAYTFTGSTLSNLGTEIDIDFGNNFGTTGKNVKVADMDIRVTSGVAVGLNSNPPPPELRPIETELRFCQRYYEISTYSSLADDFISAVITPTYSYAHWIFHTQKRAVPSFLVVSGSWSNATPTIFTSVDGVWFQNSTTYFFLTGATGNISSSASSEIMP